MTLSHLVICNNVYVRFHLYIQVRSHLYIQVRSTSPHFYYFYAKPKPSVSVIAYLNLCTIVSKLTYAGSSIILGHV